MEEIYAMGYEEGQKDLLSSGDAVCPFPLSSHYPLLIELIETATEP